MSSWTPISAEQLELLLQAQLTDCTQEQQLCFSQYRVPPYRVPIHRLGNLEQVFVVAKLPTGLLYFEDVEEGFEVGLLGADGALPNQGCNQCELKHALARALLLPGLKWNHSNELLHPVARPWIHVFDKSLIDDADK